MMTNWFQTEIEGKMNKSNGVANYNSSMEGVDMYDAYLTSYCSTRKRLKYHITEDQTVRQTVKKCPNDKAE